jgi:O-antigen/teichoic acid export membrane protein
VTPPDDLPDTARPGERLVLVGAVLFAVGAVGVVGVVVPFFFGRDDAPLLWTLLAAVMPVGLGLALVGLLRGVHTERPDDTDGD